MDGLQRADFNYFWGWSMLMAGNPGHSIVERDGLVLTTGPDAFPFHSYAFLAVSRRPLNERLEEIRQHFAGGRRPYIVRFRDGAIPGAGEALRSAGYDRVPGYDPPLMVLEHPVPASSRLAVDVRCCREPADLELWASTMSAGYGVPLDMAVAFTSPVRVAVPGYSLFLGYLDGEPVATSCLYLSHGVAGVFLVSTLPGRRGNGLGTTLTWHAVSRGIEAGADIASLQSTAAGYAMYERMGFRHLGTYHSYEAEASVA